ncbi:MAG: penicillin-insensitive murein endopeptidase [Nannocystaceae bacterium]
MPRIPAAKRPFGLVSAIFAALALSLGASPQVAAGPVPTRLQEQAAEVLLPSVLDPEDPAGAGDADADADAPTPRRAPGAARGSSHDDPDALDESEGEGEDDSEEGDAEGWSLDDEDDAPAPPKKGSGSSSSRSKSRSASAAKSKPAPRPKGAAECGYRTPLHEHEIQRGETLGAIAGRYGVRRAELVELNKIKDPNLIRPGHKLKVCPEIAPKIRRSIEVEVKKGESLIKIAERHGLSVKELVALQPTKVRDRLTKSPKALRIGEKLTVTVEVAAVPVYVADGGGKTRTPSAVVQLPAKGGLYHVKRPTLAYGTAQTVRSIQAAISRYKQRKPRGPKVHVGDISRQGGGPLRGHRSHQKGVDVDIGLVHKGLLAGETKFVDANPATLDVARTWALVKAFADTKEVRAIFLDYGVQKVLYEYAKRQGVGEETLDELFQYPRGKGHSHGLIRHWKGHRNHFHVRFHH